MGPESFGEKEVLRLARTIHYNLLRDTEYSRPLLFANNPYKMKVVEEILNLGEDSPDLDELWMENIVLLSHLAPEALDSNITTFILKINTQMATELTRQILNKENTLKRLNLLVEFCKNIFSNENEFVIRLILDQNLAKVLINLIDRFRDNYQILEAILKIMVLFIADDDMVTFFLNSNVGQKIVDVVSEIPSPSKSCIINSLLIQKAVIELKPYAFTKTVKIDLLSLLLEQYAKSTDAGFKSDLISILISIYQNPDFRDLMSHQEVIFLG